MKKMSGLNRVLLLGNLGRDAKLLHGPKGGSVLAFSMATTTRVKEYGQWKDATEWHDVVVLGNNAEGLSEHLTKGKQIVVDGRLRKRKWTDKAGNKRETVEVVVDQLRFCGRKGAGDGPSGDDGDEYLDDGADGSSGDDHGDATGGADSYGDDEYDGH